MASLLALALAMALPICTGADQTFPRLRYRLESYSTAGAEVDGRHLVLDAYPLRSYTHFFSTSDFRSRYNFTVHVRQKAGDGKRIGMFITNWEFGEEQLLGERRLRRRRAAGTEKAAKSKICERYAIRLSYPEDPDKAPVYLCGQNGVQANVTDLLNMGDYQGPGSVLVQVANHFLQGPIFRNLSFMAPIQFTKLQGLGMGADPNYKSVSGRSIPDSSIGGITFTMYQDCSESTDLNLPLRPCSPLHNTTCIASALFCNGEVDCATTIWDLFFHPKFQFGENSSTSWAEVGEDLNPSFDESNVTCGGALHRLWTKTTVTYTYTRSSNNSYSGSGGVVFWVIFSVICSIFGCVAKQKRTGAQRDEGGTAEDDFVGATALRCPPQAERRSSELRRPLQTDMI